MIVDKAMLVGVSTVGGAALAASLWVAGWMWVGKRQSDADLNTARAETVQTVDYADRLCNVFGATYTPNPAVGGKIPPRKRWGETCLAIARELWRREQGRASETVGVVTQHNAQQTKKRAVDAVAAQRDALRDSTAKQELETAHAGNKDGQLGPDDFRALNRAFGLRPPIDVQTGSVEPAPRVAGGGGAD